MMNFKHLTAALCGLLVVLTAGAAAGKKISDYTETLTVVDAWLYEIAVPGVTNYKVTFGTMATNILARVPGGGGGGGDVTTAQLNTASNVVWSGKQAGSFILTNISAMGITNILAATGIALGTNSGKLWITNTGALLNVLDFGADPTGVLDSQPAFQAAANAGSYNFIHRLGIRVPGGTYRLGSPVVCTNRSTWFVGDSMLGAEIHSKTNMFIFASGTNSMEDCGLFNMTLIGDPLVNNATMVYAYDVRGFYAEKVRLFSFNTTNGNNCIGFKFQGRDAIIIKECMIYCARPIVFGVCSNRITAGSDFFNIDNTGMVCESTNVAIYCEDGVKLFNGIVQNSWFGLCGGGFYSRDTSVANATYETSTSLHFLNNRWEQEATHGPFGWAIDIASLNNPLWNLVVENSGFGFFSNGAKLTNVQNVTFQNVFGSIGSVGGGAYGTTNILMAGGNTLAMVNCQWASGTTNILPGLVNVWSANGAVNSSTPDGYSVWTTNRTMQALRVGQVIVTNQTPTGLSFAVYASNNVTPNFIITSNGNAGFGLSVPAQLLNVNGNIRSDRTNNSGQYLDLDGGTVTGPSLIAQGSAKPLRLVNLSTGGILLQTPGAGNAVVILDSGFTGIGTSVPVSNLDVPGEGRFGSLKATGAVVFAAASSVGQVPTFRSDGSLSPSNVVATASGTNFPPVTTTGTNIAIGTGVMKSLLMPTNASVGISFNGTEILGENLTIVVTNTSAAASNITINFFQDGVASSYFDAMVASNVTGFLVVSNSSKRMEFVYNGTFWRLESTLAKEMELAIAGGLSLHTNTVTSIVTLSNSLAIQQLNNVGVGTPADGHILSWNAAMGRWTNGVVPGGDVISNITVSATNNVLIDFGAANIFKLTLLTNWTETFTNVTLLTKKGYVYYQQDTNGARLLNNYYVSGGLLQTNATENMQPTTNASALDLLEIMPGFFTTNLIAYWPQDFQPRIKFTNSLHAFASFLDTFNRSNADPMSTTASDGNTWTSGPGALGEPRIVSAMLFGNAGATGCRVLTPTLAGNQRANLTLLNDIGHIGPMVRIQSTSVASGYMLVADDATHLAIYKITDTGTLANVVLFTSTATPPMVPGDIITLSVNGTTLEAFLNGVSYGSVVDATFSGGQPGIWADTDTASGGPFTASEQ